ITTLNIADTSAFLQNPSLGYLSSQVSASGYEKKVEQNRILPDFSIGYFSQTMRGTQEVNGTDVTFGAGDRFTGIQAGISIPLWTTPYVARAKAAKYREQSVRADAEQASVSLRNAYLNAVDEYKKYSGSIDYYENQALHEADIIIGQSTLSYKAGSLDYIEYVLTLNRALEIKQNYLDALNSYNQTIISIDYLTGKIF
ncbi:MAG TPA: TolC family protein, partial [Bacteroidales bacterium]|nr:TolC family protein [Bacteroidales bacterium]